jgi:hypothetical protein
MVTIIALMLKKVKIYSIITSVITVEKNKTLC